MKPSFRLTLIATAIAAAVGNPVFAQAADAASAAAIDPAELAQMRADMEALRAELAALKRQLNQSAHSASAAATDQAIEKAVAEKTKDMPKITTKGKFKVESRDGSWSFQPIGRVMWDALSVNGDSNSKTDDFDGTELRRARLGFEGAIKDWSYKFEADFAGGSASIKDAYVGYGTKLGNAEFKTKIGQSFIPFGLNTKISSKYMTFMDRPWFADSNISPARESGVVALLADPGYRWTLASGVTIGEIKSGSTNEDVSGTTFAVRASAVPFMKDHEHMLQIGGGYLNVSGNDSPFQFKQRLVAHKDPNRIVSGSIAAGNYDGSDAFTLDALGIYGPFHAMAEYLNFQADSKLANNDIDIDGFAVEAGYFLTGESVKWKEGYTSGITPKSSAGAWQIGLRYETLNIDDGLAAGDDEAAKWTVGLNYYPTANLRLMLDYDGVTKWNQNGLDVGRNPSALKFRIQAYW